MFKGQQGGQYSWTRMTKEVCRNKVMTLVGFYSELNVELYVGAARGPPKEGFVVGSRTQGFQEILKIWDILTPTSLNWRKGHMEQGH